ncbi:MAG: hypothetical protein HY686_03240 [Chloroflexi bacterium]|nr:hypothetical protein [Chloroflexota bacterium]
MPTDGAAAVVGLVSLPLLAQLLAPLALPVAFFSLRPPHDVAWRGLNSAPPHNPPNR